MEGGSRAGWPGKGRLRHLGGNKETDEIFVLAALEKASAPAHEHIPGGPYGELIHTLSGELHDYTDDGEKVVLIPGETLMHAGATKHEPWAIGFWLGFYHQPRGQRTLPYAERDELRRGRLDQGRIDE